MAHLVARVLVEAVVVVAVLEEDEGLADVETPFLALLTVKCTRSVGMRWTLPSESRVSMASPSVTSVTVATTTSVAMLVASRRVWGWLTQ